MFQLNPNDILIFFVSVAVLGQLLFGSVDTADEE
jgi:hypothetical protein